jgi:DinB superfamily
MILPTDTLNALLLEAFSGQISWLEASTRYPVEDFIDTFYATRALTQKTIADLGDDEAWFASQVHPFWSLSETVTHLIYSQGFYHNKLLDIATSQLPHMLEAARGFGEGARANVPAAELKQNLEEATRQIGSAIETTRNAYDSEKTDYGTLFGDCTYCTWMLLLLGHEVDHVRQAIAMRRLSRREKK